MIPQSPIDQHIGFITRKAAFYAKSYCIPVEDLIQEGCLAVLHAAEKYEDRGFTFLTYAGQWIRSYMSDYCRKHARNIRVPEEKAKSVSIFEISIHAPVGEDETYTIENQLPFEETATTEANLATQHEALTTAIDTLPESEAAVIRAYFFEGQNTIQIAERMGITRSGVSFKKKCALKKLRFRLKPLMQEAA